MHGCEGPTTFQGLTFEGDSGLPKGGYAGTVVYTTALKSLTRLHLNGLENPPGGFLKLNNVDYLLQMIREVGDDPDAEYFTTEDPEAIRISFPRKVKGRGVAVTEIRKDLNLRRYR